MRSRTIFLVCVVLAVGLANGASAARFSFKLDFGLEGQNVPEGFCEISGGPGSSPTPWIVDNVCGSGIDVNLMTTYTVSPCLGFRNNGFHPLFGDCIFVDNYPRHGLIVTLSGLEPGDYAFTGYHNHIALRTTGLVDVYVNEELVLTDVVQSGIGPGGDFSNVGTSNLEFTIAQGQTSVEFKFLPAAAPPNDVHLNGLIIEEYNPMAASEPYPPDGAKNVEPNVILNWKPGGYAAAHDVYLGTDFDAVLNATTSSPEYKGSQNRDANSYDPTPGGELLDLGLTYYWRVDEVNDVDKWTGYVWSFTVKGPKAYNPCPADGIWSVAIDANLSWMAGAFATSHDVYFGTEPDALSLVSPGQVSTSYDPGPLESGQTYYYWRIDEHGPLGDFRGDLWSFSTVGGIVLHYKFDETDGNTAVDSSGHGLDGTVDEPYWDPDGQVGGCLGFDVNTVVSSPKTLFSNIGRGITVALWLNGSESPRLNDDYFNYLFHAGYGGGGNFACALGAVVPREWGEWEQCVGFIAGRGADYLRCFCDSEPEDWQGEWNHYAFVKDEIAQTMRTYHNGLPVGEKTGVNPDTLALFQNGGILIGRGWEHDRDHFQGRLDDFRIYDYALSDLEIVRLLRGGDLGLAWGPRPREGAVDVPQDVVLAWQPGDYAASHDVYFGTDWDDVNDANASSAEYKGRQDVADINYAPGLLDLGTTYYWRIDEVNDANADSPWKGKVWSFTTIAYLVVDDMESYDLVVNRIGDTWLDGWDNLSGSEVSLGRLEYDDPVHGGSQSMKYTYDNGDSGGWDLDYYSEVQRTFDEPQDWTISKTKALVLYFYGKPDNVAGATEQLNLALEDAASHTGIVPYNGDISDIQEDEWHQWSINLKDPCLVAANVNPASIKTISIIIGDRNNKNPGGTPGGVGTVYFDDIRLYLPRCLPWAPKHPADFNGDCIVDIDDLGIMADDWLEHDYTVAAQAPGPSVLQYNFDETYGGIADDSSSNNYDGKAKDINDLAVEAIWQTGGKSGGCIRFDKTKDYALEVPVAAFNSHINNQITVTTWVNWDDPDTMPAETNQLLSVHSGDNRVIGVETEWKAGRLRFWDIIGAGTTYTAREQDWSGGWNHYAFVKDVAGCYLRIYLNGKLVAENTSSAPMLFPANLARIGMATDSWHDDYTGLVDDFRIYSSALSDAEIAQVITGGPDLYIPIDTPVNLYDKEPANSRAVNFRDYAELMESWLDKLLWPAE